MNILTNFYKLFVYTFILSIVSSYSLAISSDWSVSETSKLRLISPYSQNDAKNLLIGLEYEMEPGWKTYWKSPGDEVLLNQSLGIIQLMFKMLIFNGLLLLSLKY